MSSTDLVPLTRSQPTVRRVGTASKPRSMTIEQRTKAMFPHWPKQLLDEYRQQWVATGDADQALALVRQGKNYDQFYPGNRRSDGTLRFSEGEYYATVVGYRNTLRSYGLDPTEFEARGLFAKAIEGELSVNEVARRTSAVYTSLEADIPQMRQWYARNYDINLSDQAIFASALDSSIGEDLLAQRLTSAQIGGLAASFGFQRDYRQVSKLAGAGLDRDEAKQLYGRAQAELGNLNALAGRWDRYDRNVDIGEFEDAMASGSVKTQQRFEGLVRSEQSSFGQGPSARTDREGGLIGLRQR